MNTTRNISGPLLAIMVVGLVGVGWYLFATAS